MAKKQLPASTPEGGRKSEKYEQAQIEPILVNEERSAARLGISKKYFRAYVKEGWIHPIHPQHPSGVGFTRRNLYRVSDLEALRERWAAANEKARKATPARKPAA